MIIPVHPDDPAEVVGLRAIGYWRGAWDRYKKLPDPRDYVDLTWDAAERELVASYLEAGKDVVLWKGSSQCRFCGADNGSTCKADGAFVWPEGLAHYVRVHGVRPPQEFVDHVRKVRGYDRRPQRSPA